MNRIGIYIIAVLFALVILLFTCTFKVRFNEQAIVTTFGNAGDNSNVTSAGLHFKWPYPIQAVRKFDTRTRVLETRIENVVTKDHQLVTVQLFLTWNIEDVLKYYKSSENDRKAAERLTDRLRSNLGVFSSYNFGELLTQTSGDTKMSEVEQRMLDLLASPTDGSDGAFTYGVRPQTLGITRFILPEDTTTAVFDRMKQTRQRLAAGVRSSGGAEAERIKTEAMTTALKIQQFAERRAASIRAIGEREAATYIGRQASLDEEFAIFLNQLSAMEEMVKEGTTFVFPAVYPFQLLIQPPGADDAAPPQEFTRP